MDDIKLAMLGNKEAAKRLTDAGRGGLVSCPFCGGEAMKCKPIDLMHHYFGKKGGMECCATCCNLKVYQRGSKSVRKCVAYGGYPHPECRWGNNETPDEDDYCSFAKRLEVSKNG